MPEIAMPTKCGICGRKFYGPAVGLTGNLKAGQQPPPRMVHFLQQLAEHMAKDHQEHYAYAMQKGFELQGWMILSRYTTEDPDVESQRDFLRWSLHQSTLSATAQNLDVRAREVAEEFIDAKKEVLEKAIEEEFLNRCMEQASRRPKFFETIIEELTEDLAGQIEDVLEELREILEEPDKYTPAPAGEEAKTPTVIV